LVDRLTRVLGSNGHNGQSEQLNCDRTGVGPRWRAQLAALQGGSEGRFLPSPDCFLPTASLIDVKSGKKKALSLRKGLFSSAPRGTRTLGLLVRNQTL
jgi:hypothetical protein